MDRKSVLENESNGLVCENYSFKWKKSILASLSELINFNQEIVNIQFKYEIRPESSFFSNVNIF